MSNYKTYKIESIHHKIDIGIKLSQFWFRGHSECFENLIPSIFRRGEDTRSAWNGGIANQEFEYIEKYQRKVPIFSDNIHEPKNIRWLFMMQHYGAPTRILDWTENVLVAAYFAVNTKQDEDGEIWAIRPQYLNKHYAGDKSLYLWHSPQIKFLGKEPFHTNSGKLALKLGVKKVETPLAFYPPLENPRMVAQSSAFTIHPATKENESNTITSLLKDKEIVRYMIPANIKGGILSELNELGINRTRLFPERESVAIDLIDNWKPILDVVVEIPECGGAYEINHKTKYIELNKYLAGKLDEVAITLSYKDIERIIAAKLPESAYMYRPWWTNGGHSHSLAWLDAGWKVHKIKLGQSVEFVLKV